MIRPDSARPMGNHLSPFVASFPFANKRCAKGGMIVKATTTEASKANVFVYARGLKSFPSAASIVKTGRNDTTVVAMAVSTALLTSEDAV